MRRLLVGRRALKQLEAIYARSQALFGPDAHHRYTLLMAAALRDLIDDPERPGVRHATQRGVRLYPIRLSRDRLPVDLRVNRPRHLIAFRATEEIVRVLAVLDERSAAAARLSS